MDNKPNILHEDLAAALQQMGKVVDVTPEDLLRIFDLTLTEVQKRHQTFCHKEWVREIMKSPVITCTPQTTVEAAARILLEKNIHCLPVVEEGEKLVGIVTESDLLFQFSSEPAGSPVKHLFSRKRVQKPGERIGDIMVKHVTTLHPEDSIKKVIHLMLKHGYGRIPVVDQENILVGIVARKDILQFLR
ncbi:hypothetical protein SY88_08385 [Clostridiales bacterium PH28_bin88]|nr:hypothetical protein SY88_08385 [Clostridiales bacterium PH28_bin88]